VEPSGPKYDLLLYSLQSDIAEELEDIIARDQLIAYRSFTQAGVATVVFGRLSGVRERPPQEMLATVMPVPPVGGARARKTSEGLALDSRTGVDGPRLRLPASLDGSSKLVRIVVDSPSHSSITLSYATSEGQEYSTRRSLVAGRNQLAFGIADDKAVGQIAMLLGNAGGTFLIRTLTVSDFSLAELVGRRGGP
jgi:hypothetical protein